MTREEAICCLSVHSSTNGSGLCTDEQHYEAKQMAIEALEQEPCEDAISKQAVDTLVDELARAISDERCCMSRGRSTATIMQDILDLPPVKPQEKTGQWIMRHRKVNTINYRTGEDVLTGEIHTVKELIRYETDEPYCACCGKRAEDISQDYCGYCGARMEVEQNG